MNQMRIILTITFIALSTTFSIGQTPSVGTSIQADFDGDGKMEFAFIVMTMEGEGNPMEDGTSDEYSVFFSTDKLKEIALGCCDVRLINEGDLDGDGRDEISIYQAPMNGFTYYMATYTLVKNSWEILFESFLIPTAGEYLSDEVLQNKIFKENGSVYYYDVDVNDEDFKLVKTKAILK